MNAKNPPLRCLHVEDSEDDARLILRSLQSAFDVTSTRVETAEALRTALAGGPWDIVLCDYRMPHFSGLDALAVVQASGLDLPFIIVSGKVGEEAAVVAMRAGAHDYVMKDSLARLVPAVERELSFAASRHARRLADSEFFASEVRYRRLFDSAVDGILIVNADSGTILDANCALLEQLGLAREQLVGLKIGTLPYFPALIPDDAAFAALQGQLCSLRGDSHLVTATGQQLAVEFVTSLYIVDEHRMMQCNIRDIRARLAATAQLRKLSTIIEQAPMSVVITDLTGSIEYVNQRFCTVTGYTLAEVLGKNPRILNSGKTPLEVYRDLWTTILRGAPWNGELLNRKKNGELYLESVVIAPVMDAHGQATHYFAMKDDVTAQRRIVAETEALLTREREMSAMKSRFIAVTSHEFRTPMAAAMASADLLHNHFDRILPAKREELFDRINSSLCRMTRMLDELLFLNRIEASRVEVRLAALDLCDFIQGTIEEIRLGDHEAHRFEFAATDPALRVLSDSDLLHHILSNLLSNAVRYSAADSVITTHLALTPEQIRISVEDHGIGVPEADRERIFEPFERGSNVGDIKGTGLGLNIVKRMCGLLGGTIAHEKTPSGGSRFVVLLPRPAGPASLLS